jgi:Zn-dependent metalloprotease
MRIFSMWLAFSTLVLLAALSPFGAILSATPSQPPDLAATLRQQSTGPVRIAYHAATGKARFVGASPGQPIRHSAGRARATSPTGAARDFLADYGALFGLTDQARELVVERERSIDRGRASVRFRQVYQGIPVVAGELMVQVDSAGNTISADGEIAPIVGLPTTPEVTADSAQQSALQLAARTYAVDVHSLTSSKPELWIYQPALLEPRGGPTRLVWRMDVTPRDLLPIRELVLIDARSGAVALAFNQVDTARNRLTYTANNSTSLPGTLVCNESNPSCSGGDSHAVAAHVYAGSTYDFYATTHGRNSIDNAGLTIVSTVHYSSNYQNAFWNGSQMVYGDGFGFPLADDVVAHELTHGVTQYESNLFYYYQSGAINESLSDVWGELIDQTNGAGNDTAGVRWLLGEDVSGLGAIRNMQNPPAFGDPDKISSANYYKGTCTYYNDPANNCDNGGVHTNSGVNNKAAFLMTDGGSFNGQTVTGLGATKVAKIYYEAQTNLLVSGSDYADLYDLLYQGCLNLVGTAGISAPDCQQVRNATLAVEMNQQPAAGYNPDAPICASSQPTDLFFDGLENNSSNWTFGALTGTSRWQRDSPYGAYAHSGSHFLYADDSPSAKSDSFAAMNSSISLPANAYLHFAHAFGFQGTGSDGGVLEYSTNGGSTWNDAGSLFDTNGYNGTITTANNTLNPRAAFVADSHGYISSRLSLASLAGQSVRFRWRMATDLSLFDWGWFVDDVRIYTCATSPTNTPTNTPTTTPTNTPTSTATQTSTPTSTPTNTPTNTPTSTATQTSTPTSTPTQTSTPTSTATQTSTPTPTSTLAPTLGPAPAVDIYLPLIGR